MVARVLRAVGALLVGTFLGAGLPVLEYGAGPMTDSQLELGALEAVAVGCALLVAAVVPGRRRLSAAVAAFVLACAAVQWREFGLSGVFSIDALGTADRAKEALLPMVWASWLLWGRTEQPRPLLAGPEAEVQAERPSASASVELDPVLLSTSAG